MRVYVVASFVFVGFVTGFAPLMPRGRSATHLAGLLGRFRKKRPVEQVKTITAGDKLPEGDIEVLKQGVEGIVDCEAVSVDELLGKGKTLLVGMPGAFTPVCSAEHLPGYVKNAPQLKEAGVDTIAILTTNDRYVNEEWSSQKGALSSSGLIVLCDGDGDFVKTLGLAEDMGFGVGVRSKRFVLLLDNGKVEKVILDEGMDSCSATSAETVLKILVPEVPQEEEAGAVTGVVALAGVAAALVFAVTGTGDNSLPTVNPSPTPVRIEKANPSAAPKSSKGFSLLDEFKQ